MKAFVAVAVLAMLFVPLTASAATWIPIVPCGSAGQPTCSPCHLFQGIKNVSDLVLYGITGPIAAFLVVLAGGMMILGGASPTQYSRGKQLLTNTLAGVAIILISWSATNFLLKSVATGASTDRWYQFTCPAFLADIQNVPLELPKGYGIVEPKPAPPLFQLPAYIDGAALLTIAQRNNVPYPRQNSDALKRLVDCVYQDPFVKALAYPKPVMGGNGQQTNNVFTYDNRYDVCNYTRGYAIFGGGCSHGHPSCHYGGKTGKNGAEAVDINAQKKNVRVEGVTDAEGKPLIIYASEERLFCELYRVLVAENKCPDFKFIDLHQGHSHISTKACDVDGNGAGATFNPKACAQVLAAPPASSGQ